MVIRYRWNSITTSLLCLGIGVAFGSSITLSIVSPALIK